MEETEKSGLCFGVYAVFDKVADNYDIPFFAKDDLFAQRKFIMDARNDQTVLASFLEDFELVRLCIWYPATGEFIVSKKTVLKGKNIPREV